MQITDKIRIFAIVMAGLYIHIPFCASRCIYCGFYSTTQLSQQDRYVDALCKEMELRPLNAAFSPLTSIYLGGGTPSQLSSPNLERLFLYINKVYGINNVYGENLGDIEITMECNPDDVTEELAALLSRLPVNRVSMGAQTFSDKRLQLLRRRHHAQQVDEAVERLRKAGIENISIDLMFGFPNETLLEWEHDLERALSLQVEHISAYSLMYEEGTRLCQLKDQGLRAYTPISDELSRQMYEVLKDRLEQAGYEHYEISNFARKRTDGGSWRSRHNSSYWQGIPYIGIGAAAHSYQLNTRSWNVSDLNAYMRAIESGKLPSEEEVLDEDTRYNDLITTAMRTREGICIEQLSDKYRTYLLQTASRSLQHELLTIENGYLHLTREGLFVSDDVMSDLIYL